MIDDQDAQEHPAALDLLDRGQHSGGGGPGGVPGGGGVEVSSIRWWRAMRWTVRP